MADGRCSPCWAHFLAWADDSGYGDLGLLPEGEFSEASQVFRRVSQGCNPRGIYGARRLFGLVVSRPEREVAAVRLNGFTRSARSLPRTSLGWFLWDEALKAIREKPLGGRRWGATRSLAFAFFYAPRWVVLFGERQKNPDGAEMAVSRAWHLFRWGLVPVLEDLGWRWWQIVLLLYLIWAVPLPLAQEEKEAVSAQVDKAWLGISFGEG